MKKTVFYLLYIVRSNVHCSITLLFKNLNISVIFLRGVRACGPATFEIHFPKGGVRGRYFVLNSWLLFVQAIASHHSKFHYDEGLDYNWHREKERTSFQPPHVVTLILIIQKEAVVSIKEFATHPNGVCQYPTCRRDCVEESYSISSH